MKATSSGLQERKPAPITVSAASSSNTSLDDDETTLDSGGGGSGGSPTHARGGGEISTSKTNTTRTSTTAGGGGGGGGKTGTKQEQQQQQHPHNSPIASERKGNALKSISRSLGNVLNRLHRKNSQSSFDGTGSGFTDDDVDSTQGETKEAPSVTENYERHLTSSRSSPNMSRRRKTTREIDSVFNLSAPELAFLSQDVRKRLGKAAGTLPPAPSLFKNRGAVLFVDVSGFTALGEELRASMGPVEGGRALAEAINKMISMLTGVCLEYNGDVAKFAGDALLCLWDASETSEAATLNTAKECAVAMLRETRELNNKNHSKLRIHGGLAFGTILHFHLGSADDQLRWYLVAGDAVVRATDLVDQASPGEILLQDTISTGAVRRVSALFMSSSLGGGTASDFMLNSASRGVSSPTAPTFTPIANAGAGGVMTPTKNNATTTTFATGGDGAGGDATSGSGITGRPGRSATITRNDERVKKQFSTVEQQMRERNNASSLPRSEVKVVYAPQFARGTLLSERGLAIKERAMTGLTMVLSPEPARDVVQRKHPALTTVGASPATPVSTSPSSFSAGGGAFRGAQSNGGMSTPSPQSGSFKPGKESTRSPSRQQQGGDEPGGNSTTNPNPNETNDSSEADAELLRSLVTLTADSPTTTTSGSSSAKQGASSGEGKRTRTKTEDDPSLRLGLPRTCNVYMPRALRKGLGEISPEMKPGVAVLFADIEDLSLTEKEASTNHVSDAKLDALNSAFVKMTRIVHALRGEVRDMLFDDKGCVFIAVFGAHPEPGGGAGGAGGGGDKLGAINPAAVAADKRRSAPRGAIPSMNSAVSATGSSALALAAIRAGAYAFPPTPGANEGGTSGSSSSSPSLWDASAEERATRASLAISSIVAGTRIGVSCGMCFVGMCGVEKRHDFIVIGHEVNMAARLMVQAERDQIIVSPAVAEKSRRFVNFTEKRVAMRKKDAVSDSVAYVPDREVARRASFMAQFRYQLLDKDLFVGRTEELRSVETALNRMVSEGHSNAIVIEGEMGIGKSALVSRIKKMGKGRIRVANGTANHPRDADNSYPYQPFYSVVTSISGLRPGMTAAEISGVLAEFRNLDAQALANVLPFVGEALGLPPPEFDLSTTDVFSEEARKHIVNVGRAFMILLQSSRTKALVSSSTTSSSSDRTRGTLLLLENIDWFDIHSLLLLEYIVNHLEVSKRLTLCMTLQPPQIDDVMGSSSSSSVAGSTVSSTLPPPPSGGLLHSSANNANKVAAPAAAATSSSSSDTLTAGTMRTQRIALVRLIAEKAKRPRTNLNIQLMGLTPEDSESLITRTLGGAAEPTVTEALYKATQGAPLHLAMLLQWCRENKLLGKSTTNNTSGDGTAGTFRWINGTAPALPMNGVTGLIRARFTKLLDLESQKMLVQVAVTGVDEFDAIFVVRLSGLGERDVLNRLRDARQFGFLVHTVDKSRQEREQLWRFKFEAVARAVVKFAKERDVGGIGIKKLQEAAVAELDARLNQSVTGDRGDFAD